MTSKQRDKIFLKKYFWIIYAYKYLIMLVNLWVINVNNLIYVVFILMSYDNT